MIANYSRIFKELLLNEKDPLESMINIVTLLLILWAVNPESIYYNWIIWVILSGTWGFFVFWKLKAKIVDFILKSELFLILIWPVWTVGLWLAGYGLLHRKFIALAFMLAIPWYFYKTGRKKQLKYISIIALCYLSFISVTTLLQMTSYPEISRDLAPGRGTGNFRASALLANFHTIYESILIVLVLLGLIYEKIKSKKFPVFYVTIALLLVVMIVFSGYDIAVLALLIGVTLTALFYLIDFFFKPNFFHPTDGKSTIERDSKFELAEAVGTSLIYVGPAFAALGFKSFINEFIYKIDFGLLAISEKLLNRIWVYLRSLILFLEFPFWGFGSEPDPTKYLSGQHSDYLEILAEYGLIGFLVFLIPWVLLLIKIRKEIKSAFIWNYWIAVIVFQFIFILNPVLEVSSVAVLFFIIPGLISSEESEAENTILEA